jgi:hypothetical protein
VNALTAQLDQVSTQGSATRTESGTASEGLDDEATRVRLARVLSALRGGDKGVDSSLWSWAFGSSEENEAATSRSTSAGVGGGVGTDGKCRRRSMRYSPISSPPSPRMMGTELEPGRMRRWSRLGSRG